MKTDIDTKIKMSFGRLLTLKNVVFCTIGMMCFGLVSYQSESAQLNIDPTSQQGPEFNSWESLLREKMKITLFTLLCALVQALGHFGNDFRIN